MTLTASAIASTSSLSIVRTRNQLRTKIEHVGSSPADLKPCPQFLSFDRRKLGVHAIRLKHASVVCSAALNAKCAAGQTQTVTWKSSTTTVAPFQGKDKSSKLDDGGTGFPPPRDDSVGGGGDGGSCGGGGGRGGGGKWSGGFLLFGFLAFLAFLKDLESEGPYEMKEDDDKWVTTTKYHNPQL